MESIAQRLKDLRKEEKLTQGGLGDILGTNQGHISAIERGENNLTVSHLSILLEKLSVNPVWLMTGNGDTYISAKDYFREKSNETIANDLSENAGVSAGVNAGVNAGVKPLVVTVDNSGRENIPMVNSKAFAGYASNFQSVEYVKKLPVFGIPLPEFRNATFRAFQASGTSMEPTIWNGDWLIGQFVDNWPGNIRDGYIYIVVTDHTILVKRLLNRVSLGRLVIQSDNEAFPTDFLQVEEVKEIWYLKAKISFQFPNTRYEVARKIANLEADLEWLKNSVTPLLSNPDS